MAIAAKMCLGIDDINLPCGECIAKQKNLKPGETLELCDEYKKFLEHYCGCCMTYKQDEIIKEGLCKKCRES